MNVCVQTMATCMGPNGFSHLPHFLEYNFPLINRLPQIIPPPPTLPTLLTIFFFSEPAKLISDNSGSDTQNIGIHQ